MVCNCSVVDDPVRCVVCNGTRECAVAARRTVWSRRCVLGSFACSELKDGNFHNASPRVGHLGSNCNKLDLQLRHRVDISLAHERHNTCGCIWILRRIMFRWLDCCPTLVPRDGWVEFGRGPKGVWCECRPSVGVVPKAGKHTLITFLRRAITVGLIVNIFHMSTYCYSIQDKPSQQRHLRKQVKNGLNRLRLRLGTWQDGTYSRLSGGWDPRWIHDSLVAVQNAVW